MSGVRECRRPILRYLGSKWRLAPDIVAQFPAHRIYVEPFGGGGAVLLRKPRTPTEIWNDLDGELVNLFAVLRDRPAELLRAIALTPYARREYQLSFEVAADPVERARRLLVRSHMSHGTNSTRLDRNPGFRGDGVSGTTRVGGEWAEFPEALAMAVERLRGVQLECRPALDLIARYDHPNVLIYADPPYLGETRSTKCKAGEGYHGYAHELTPADHEALLQALTASRAMVLLSGYDSSLYDRHLRSWRRIEIRARSQGNLTRTEVVWINPRAQAASQHLFARGAA